MAAAEATPTATMPVRRSRIVEGSCWPCRRRRIKCDLLRPTCVKCQGSGQQCDYGASTPIKWVGGTALRGRHAVRRPSLNAPEEALSMPLNDEALMLYFDDAVLPRFQLLNERLPLDLTAVVEDRPFRQTVIAVSRAHHFLAVNSGTVNSDVVRMRSRHDAIQSLREQLSNRVHTQDSAQQLFVVNVLLCILDGMIEPESGSNASTLHLRGGIAMMKQWPAMREDILAKRGIEALLLTVFATMDLVHAVLSGERPFFSSTVWHMFANVRSWWGLLSDGHWFLHLLKTYSQMATIGSVVFSALPRTDGLLMAEQRISAVETALEARPVPQNSTGSEAGMSDGIASLPSPAWQVFCELYVLGGKIYVLRALKLRPVHDAEVQAAVRQGLEFLSDSRLPDEMAHCAILPMLIIGAQCIRPQDRKTLSRHLERSSAFLAFGNMAIARDVLQHTWERAEVDVTWWNCFAELSRGTFTF